MTTRHRRIWRVLFGFLLAGTSIGCGAGEGADADEVAWRTVDTLITTESGMLGEPSDLEVGPDGTLYVVDGMNHRIHRISADGRRLPSLGSEGAGPGELQRPVVLTVAGDSLLVVDQGNGRIQVLDQNAEPLDTWQLPPYSRSQFLDIASHGYLVAATLGRDSALAVLYARDGSPIARFGAPVIEPPEAIRVNDLRSRSARGEVPDVFRNTVDPRIGPDGHVWISFTADGMIGKYAQDGSRMAAYELDEPEVEGIREAYVRANLEEESGVHPLNYVADFEVLRNEVWVLLNRPEAEPGLLLVLDEDGGIDHRIRLPEVSGARRLAIDTKRERLYLAVPHLAQVVVVKE